MSAKRKTKEEAPLELAIAVEGKIISSNFEAYKEYAEAQILAISFDLKTDEDFDRADKDAKGLKAFETRLTTAKTDFLKQLDDINALMESVDGLAELARGTRLELERKVKEKKTAVREGIVRDGIAALEVRFREFSDMIGASIKGMSSLAKMQEAVTKTVDQINARIEANRDTFAKGKDEYGDAVAFGEESFLTFTVEAAKVEMERRIERHRAAIKQAELEAEAKKARQVAEAVRIAAEKAAAEERMRQETERRLAERNKEMAKDVIELHKPDAVVAHETPSGETQAAMREETEAEEMEAFQRILKACFAPAKEARMSLKHRANIDKAEAFAQSLAAAWKTLTEGVVQ